MVFDRELGPGYAIPADDNFKRLVGVLAGVRDRVRLPRRSASRRHGDTARLMGITDNGPAEAAGLRDYDVVTHINGNSVGTFDDLMLQIGCALAVPTSS